MFKGKITVKRIIAGVLLAVLAVGGWWVSNIIWFKPTDINVFYQRALVRYAMMDPMQASQTGIFRSLGLDYFDGKLTDITNPAGLARYDFIKGELKILRSYERTKQSESQLLSTDILDWYLSDALEGREFMEFGFPLNQYLGVQKKLPEFMCNTHIINNKRDAENYIKRLSAFDTYFCQLIDNMKIQRDKGIIPSTNIINATINDMNSFIASSPENNVLYTSFVQKLENMHMDKVNRALLKDEVKSIVINVVYPTYQKLIDFYMELLPESKDYIGIGKLPRGKEYYSHLLRSITTTDMTPEEMLDMLNKEVSKLNGELEQLKTVKAQVTPHSPPIKTLGECQEVIDNMEKHLPELFGKLPKAKVKVQFFPDTGGNNGGICQYNSSDLTGSVPATIYMTNIANIANPYTTKWILYHEGVPGHHLQKALSNEMKDLPSFRRVIGFAAFTEGWATYAQTLPWEYGMTTDKDSLREMIKTKLEHAGRAVIDISINYLGWTREQAIQYAVKNNICDMYGALSYTEYCTAYPGSETSYEIGYLKILQLKEKAMSELGDRFDIREFHDTVLKNGDIPLTMLEKQVLNYIVSKKA